MLKKKTAKIKKTQIVDLKKNKSQKKTQNLKKLNTIITQHQ